MIGEKYCKGLHFKEKAWTFFLEKNRKGTFYRKKGIPRESFNKPWGELVFIIQNFLTCDRGYSVSHLYHVRLLQHIKGEHRINLPYFLHKSLTKVCKKIRAQPLSMKTTLCHFGLVKLIILEELKQQERSWEHFLFWEGFETQN